MKFSDEYVLQLEIDVTRWANKLEDEILPLLKEAHDKMDDFNVTHNKEDTVGWCRWCISEGYDGQGLLHTDNCVLIRIRKVL